jgi:3-oxoacyl-[acyl-carrier protein] reductase
MGRQTALTLARLGANVALNYGTYRTAQKAAERAAKQVAATGAVEAIAVRADTRNEADVRRMVRTAETSLGPLDIAVGNAGGDFLERPLESVTLTQWQKVVQAELDGAFLLAREVLPGMRARGGGRLIFIGWDGAERSYKPPYDYAIGKQARHDLALKLARAEERHGVRINVVAPGYIPYPSAQESKELVEHDAAWRRRARSTTQDVAEAVAWLCSDAAAHVSGSILRVYGPY